MEHEQRHYRIASANEAFDMLERFVTGERRAMQLQAELHRATTGDARAAGQQAIASLIAEQQRLHEALEAWWEAPISARPRPLCADRTSQDIPAEPHNPLSRWLHDLLHPRRRVCAE